MGTSCVALSIKNIKTRASREMTSRKINGGGTLPSTGMWQGEVFAISDCLVCTVTNMYKTTGYYFFPCYMCALWWGISALKYWYPCIQSKGASTPKIKTILHHCLICKLILDKRIAGKNGPVWSLKGHRALKITQNVHLFILWPIYDNLAVNRFFFSFYIPV